MAGYDPKFERRKRELKERFPIGSTVKLNADAARMFPRKAALKATVVAHTIDGRPKIQFEGFKSYDAWHECHLRVIAR